MNPASGKKKKPERGPLGSLFLDDPWRKLLALLLGFLAWYYISKEIKATRVMEFAITDRAQPLVATTTYMNIPTPAGFTLWRVNNHSLEEELKVRVTFEGPRQEVEAVPENLLLSIDPERLTEITPENPTLEIRREDLKTPLHPTVRGLITALEFSEGDGTLPRDHLLLGYEKIRVDWPFQLDRPGKTLSEVVVTGRANLPEGFQIDTSRPLTFDPGEVRLTGPEVVVQNLERYDPDHKRAKLLQGFHITGASRVLEDEEDRPYLVQRLTLDPEWSDLSMKPDRVRVIVHLARKPRQITYDEEGGLPVDIIGPGADKWEISKENYGPTRPVEVEIYGRDYWWKVVNKVSIPGENSKENPVEQQRWVRDFVRLYVTTADIDPSRKDAEQSVPIHYRVVTPDGRVAPPRCRITISQGGTTVKVKRRK